MRRKGVLSFGGLAAVGLIVRHGSAKESGVS
jgi:hypothetical protein